MAARRDAESTGACYEAVGSGVFRYPGWEPEEIAGLKGSSDFVGVQYYSRMRYDALQATATRRYEHGWGLTAAYTWSHAMSNARGFYSTGAQTADQSAFWPDPKNPDADWGPSPYDVRHNITVAGLIDLPWGRGRRYLSDVPGWIDALVGGWSASPIWKAHTGFAVTIQAPDQSRTQAGMLKLQEARDHAASNRSRTFANKKWHANE